jgi:hypothetical protein
MVKTESHPDLWSFPEVTTPHKTWLGTNPDRLVSFIEVVHNRVSTDKKRRVASSVFTIHDTQRRRQYLALMVGIRRVLVNIQARRSNTAITFTSLQIGCHKIG